MKILICICMMLLSACATSEPYFEVGIAHQLDQNSDWYVRTEREWQCSRNWMAEFELGLDWGKARLGYHHQSWWLCGGPFNDMHELYQDDVRLTYTFGGKQ